MLIWPKRLINGGMSGQRLTDDVSLWTDTARVNDATKAPRGRACNPLCGGGYRIGKQVGGTAPRSKSSDLEAVAIVGDAGNCAGVRRTHSKREKSIP